MTRPVPYNAQSRLVRNRSQVGTLRTAVAAVGTVVSFLSGHRPSETFYSKITDYSSNQSTSSHNTPDSLAETRSSAIRRPRFLRGLEMALESPEAAATPQATLQALAEKARWDAVPFRRAFVQRGKLDEPMPGALAEFVVRHDTAAFDTYCLVRLIASAEPYAAQVSSQLFARALRIGSPVTVSKAVKRLVDRNLLRRESSHRSVVTVLREDASGERYSPAWSSHEAYFQLPVAYWTATEEWQHTLTMAEKA